MHASNCGGRIRWHYDFLCFWDVERQCRGYSSIQRVVKMRYKDRQEVPCFGPEDVARMGEDSPHGLRKTMPCKLLFPFVDIHDVYRFVPIVDRWQARDNVLRDGIAMDREFVLHGLTHRRDTIESVGHAQKTECGVGRALLKKLNSGYHWRWYGYGLCFGNKTVLCHIGRILVE